MGATMDGPIMSVSSVLLAMERSWRSKLVDIICETNSPWTGMRGTAWTETGSDCVLVWKDENEA